MPGHLRAQRAPFCAQFCPSCHRRVPREPRKPRRHTVRGSPKERTLFASHKETKRFQKQTWRASSPPTAAAAAGAATAPAFAPAAAPHRGRRSSLQLLFRMAPCLHLCAVPLLSPLFALGHPPAARRRGINARASTRPTAARTRPIAGGFRCKYRPLGPRTPRADSVVSTLPHKLP